VAVLLVLLLLSITLGLSYAMVRTQNTVSAIARNSDRRLLAREAALAGLTMAYQNMFSQSWGGVGTSFSRSLTSYESFTVTFTAGDPTLLKSDGTLDKDKSDYRRYPFRVTLASTGTSIDPGDSTRVATHKARAIVQLIPMALASEPNRWSEALGFTLYQCSWSDYSTVAVPFRATGRVRLGALFSLGESYNWSSSAREDFLTALNVTRTTTWRVTGITRSGSTATATCSAHGFKAGDSVTISGAFQGAYNGTFTITGVTTNTFNYTVSGTPTTPATGTMITAASDRGQVDWRPLEGTNLKPILFPETWLSWFGGGILTLLDQMGIKYDDGGYLSTTLGPTSTPSTYRLYPGGPSYTVATLPQNCSGTYTADLKTNPLGILAASGSVYLNDNTTIEGTIFTGANGDVNVCGKLVNVAAAQNLLPLYSTTTTPPLRLPIVMSRDDFRVYSGASGTLRGVATAAGVFEVMSGSQVDDVMSLQLRIMSSGILIHGRTEWDQTSSWWQTQYSNFTSQSSQGKVKYFADYLQLNAGLQPQPTVIVSPDTTDTARYIWSNLQSPIYAYPNSTDGLSWQIVSWTDNP
jgi:hypothetical protein